MNQDPLLVLQASLPRLQVDTSLCGYTRVADDWHDRNYVPGYSKLYLICEGQGELRVGPQVFHPQAGQIALMPEGVIQSYGRTTGSPYLKYWCHFTARIGRTSLFDLLEPPWLLDVPADEFSGLARLFQILVDHQREPRPWSVLHQKAAILGLVSWYLERCPGAVAGQAGGDLRLQACLDYLENHLSEPLGLAELASTVHLHPAYFARLFKRQFGQPPLLYLRTRRLEEAKRLLAVPGLTLADIGDRVGIPNPFYLSRLFKAYTGFSPQQFRHLKE